MSFDNKIFISYSRKDSYYLERLQKVLKPLVRREDLDLWDDTRIQAGEAWQDKIAENLSRAKVAILLVSADFLASEFIVQQELTPILEKARTNGLKIIWVAVRASMYDETEIGKYQAANDPRHRCLDSLPAAELDRELVEIGLQIKQALRSPEVPPIPASSSRETSPAPRGQLLIDAPLPAPDFRLEPPETGTLPLDSRFYVRRPADEQMELCLAQDRGQTLVIKGTRQNGKSSLLARADAFVRQRQSPSVLLDFQDLDERDLSSCGSLLKNLALRIARALGAEISPQDVWDDELGEKPSFASFLERAVLKPAAGPVLLGLDEVDRIFATPYRNDFFAAVRSWHNRRATHEGWDRLHLALAHATDPVLWIDDLHQSPFNVGVRLHLDSFTVDEVADLNRRHGRPLRDAGEVTALRKLVGGQPYLVRQALYALVSERWTLDELKDRATRDDGPFIDHLRRHLWALQKSRRLTSAMRGVLRRGECQDERDFQDLLAAGLVVRGARRAVRPRCPLYREYLGKHL